MKAVSADWLKWITNKDSRHEFMRRPFGIRGMVAATDGKVCVIAAPHLVGDFACAAEIADGITKVGKLIDANATFLMDLPPYFKEGLGEVVLATERDCFECSGTGVGRCPDCGHACKCECESCDGTGKGTDYPEPRTAFLGEFNIDRNLLAKAVAGLPFDDVQVFAGKEPFSNNPMLRFQGTQWTVFLMPMRADETTGPLSGPRWNGQAWSDAEVPAHA